MAPGDTVASAGSTMGGAEWMRHIHTHHAQHTHTHAHKQGEWGPYQRHSYSGPCQLQEKGVVRLWVFIRMMHPLWGTA